jgi:hypothetical protein
VRRHKGKLLGALAAALLVALVVSVALAPRPAPRVRVTHEIYGRILESLEEGKERITLEEVGAAVGGPPRDYATGPSVGDRLSPGPRSDEWLTDTAGLRVTVDADGGVDGVYYFPVVRKHGPVDWLGWQADRQWRRWFP